MNRASKTVSEAIKLHQSDNVATVRLVRLEESGECLVSYGDTLQHIRLPKPIDFGHKFAVVSIPKGSPIIKYGRTIGVATDFIGVGEHVHVHNVVGRRDTGRAHAHSVHLESQKGDTR